MILSQPSINPVAKALYLCDGHIGSANQKTDLVGLFNSIRPARYPHAQQYLVVFAQLLGGLGQVPFYIDFRYAADGALVHTTSAQLLHFSARHSLIQMVHTIRGCVFPQPGTYLVELFCNGQWVADTTLELL